MHKLRITQAAAVLLAIAASTLTAGTATAVTTADPICTGHGADNRLDWGYIKNRDTAKNVGVVELCQRWANGTLIRWTNVQLYYTMGRDDRANGRLLYRKVGVPGEVLHASCALWAPDRGCSTEKTDWRSGWQDRADAYIYNVNNAIVAAGATEWTS